MKIKIVSSLLFLFIAFQCKDKTNDFSSYRSKMLINLNTSIEKQHTELKIAAKILDNNITAYILSGSISDLEKTIASWYTFIDQWNSIRTFNIYSVKQNILHTFIYSKPDANKIEQNIINKPNITENEVNNLGADQKGINAIEYLLFKENNLTETNNAFNNYPNYENRKNLLKKLSKELLNQIENLESSWLLNDKANYLANTDIELGSSLSETFNGLVEVITINLKDLNKHLTDNSFETNGYYSSSELRQLKKSIEGIETIFNLNGKESFRTYLELKSGNTVLIENLANAFKNIIEDDVFSFNSYQELNTSQKEILKNKLFDLSALLSIEVSNELRILVTLSDSDGD